MRLTLTFFLVAGLAMAANTPQEVTYVDGTLDGFSLATETTLQLASAKHMVLHAKGAKNVEIPFSSVTSVDRQTVPVSVEKEPLYKVWNLPKRLAPAAPVEKLAFEFRDKSGSIQRVTLETDKKTADRVQANLKLAAQKRANDHGAWWGDEVWKTNRNKSEWGGAGAIASRE